MLGLIWRIVRSWPVDGFASSVMGIVLYFLLVVVVRGLGTSPTPSNCLLFATSFATPSTYRRAASLPISPGLAKRSVQGTPAIQIVSSIVSSVAFRDSLQ